MTVNERVLLALLAVQLLSGCVSARAAGPEADASGAEADAGGQEATADAAPLRAGSANGESDVSGDVFASYSEEQAQRGRQVWRSVCRECHFLSEVRGRAFKDSWSRRTLRDLYRQVTRTMPDDNPGSLEVQQYLDVVAYILQLNRFPAGPNELRADEEAMRALRLRPVAEAGNSP